MRRPTAQPRAAADTMRSSRTCARVRRRHRALDETAAEHARLALACVVEHAGLPRRDAVLAVDQFDLVAAVRRAQPRRLRRPRRAHLDENFAADGSRRCRRRRAS